VYFVIRRLAVTDSRPRPLTFFAAYLYSFLVSLFRVSTSNAFPRVKSSLLWQDLFIRRYASHSTLGQIVDLVPPYFAPFPLTFGDCVLRTKCARGYLRPDDTEARYQGDLYCDIGTWEPLRLESDALLRRFVAVSPTLVSSSEFSPVPTTGETLHNFFSCSCESPHPRELTLPVLEASQLNLCTLI